MPRRRTERALLAALSAAAESDDGTEELSALFEEHGSVIATSLGMSTLQLQAIQSAPPMDRTVKVRVALRRHRKRRIEAFLERARCSTLEAACALVGTSYWREGHLELDVNIVLGSLLADPARKAIQFEAEGLGTVAVLRSKLKEAARALVFADVRCFVDERGLNFRWGRGGLLLISQDTERFEADAVLIIEFPRPQPRRSLSLVRPSAVAPLPMRVGDVLIELGFF